jgi:oxygen-independent coproporphyrinogen-3 oxidase
MQGAIGSDGAPVGVKWVNAATGADYRQRVQETGRGTATRFEYTARDQKLLHVTRKLARMRISRARYQRRFGTDVVHDFGGELRALRRRGLLRIGDRAVSLTATGMFYADSAAGLLAWRRVEQLRLARLPYRRRLPMHSAAQHHMG